MRKSSSMRVFSLKSSCSPYVLTPYRAAVAWATVLVCPSSYANMYIQQRKIRESSYQNISYLVSHTKYTCVLHPTALHARRDYSKQPTVRKTTTTKIKNSHILDSVSHISCTTYRRQELCRLTAGEFFHILTWRARFDPLPPLLSSLPPAPRLWVPGFESTAYMSSPPLAPLSLPTFSMASVRCSAVLWWRSGGEQRGGGGGDAFS